MTLGWSQKSLTLLLGQSQLKMTFFQNPGCCPYMLILPQNVPPHLEGGGQISYRLSNYPGIESAIRDFIIRSESAKNDFFSKPRLH